MILENPTDPRIQALVDPSHLAIRSSLRPLDHISESHIGGHYRIAFASGLTTVLNAADAVVSLRWNEPDRVLVLHRLRVAAVISTAFGTAQETSLDLVRMSNFSANDTGGTAIAIGSGNKKGRNMSASRISDLRVANATALGAGTGTADANALSKVVLATGNAVGGAAADDFFTISPGLEHPLVVEALEGFRVRIGFTQGATGVVRFTFTMDWSEIPKGYGA